MCTVWEVRRRTNRQYITFFSLDLFELVGVVFYENHIISVAWDCVGGTDRKPYIKW